ncbi:tripartite tricarboxylate transporter substrate binding protein [Comamonas sp. Y33R10-2]|uniref:Bug family tripartite tricarboxylate transporter substrate binding protein n=1 Tax=Comamonas sp. Y33R10-2 TaxID=2853257 RepID=UPI001C5C84F4|nr:tripartite tricarboxylate transporter substrate binding protein [Comamonas sp. Y33R10-2]QXZ10708.1 tripartite tricarboxylate transporter substrate binding protein [Comamonas sp. Y33R10-2]
MTATKLICKVPQVIGKSLQEHSVMMAFVLALLSQGAQATGYPERPIKFIAAATAGSPADIMARAVAEGMTKELRTPIIVENKPGADQVIGFEFVARGAPADGYTVGVIGIDGQALLPLTKKGLRFNPLEDLTTVAGLGEGRYVLAGPATAPQKNFKDIVEEIKSHPNKYDYGTSGPAVLIPMLALTNELKLTMTHIPYKGGGPYSQDLAAGNIHLGFLSETSARPLSNRLRFYGVTGSTRSAFEPNVPTFIELGYPQIFGPAYALVVRTGTPQAIIEKLSAAAEQALRSTEMKERSQGLLLSLKYEPAEMATRTLNERAKIYRHIAQRMGLKPE